MNVTS